MVEYFCQNYLNVLHLKDSHEMDRLQEEFLEYQLLEEKNIPESTWKEALVYDDQDNGVKRYRMDIIWGYLGGLTTAEGFCHALKVF